MCELLYNFVGLLTIAYYLLHSPIHYLTQKITKTYFFCMFNLNKEILLIAELVPTLSGLRLEHFCLKIVKNRSAKKSFFFVLILPYKTWWKPRFPMD